MRLIIFIGICVNTLVYFANCEHPSCEGDSNPAHLLSIEENYEYVGFLRNVIVELCRSCYKKLRVVNSIEKCKVLAAIETSKFDENNRELKLTRTPEHEKIMKKESDAALNALTELSTNIQADPHIPIPAQMDVFEAIIIAFDRLGRIKREPLDETAPRGFMLFDYWVMVVSRGDLGNQLPHVMQEKLKSVVKKIPQLQ